MSETEARITAIGDREVWSEEHRVHVYWFEKAAALGTVIVATWFAPGNEGIAQYFFVGMGSIGLWKLFPSIRPMVSRVVDRLPFLASKTPDE